MGKSKIYILSCILLIAIFFSGCSKSDESKDVDKKETEKEIEFVYDDESDKKDEASSDKQIDSDNKTSHVDNQESSENDSTNASEKKMKLMVVKALNKW